MTSCCHLARHDRLFGSIDATVGRLFITDISVRRATLWPFLRNQLGRKRALVHLAIFLLLHELASSFQLCLMLSLDVFNASLLIALTFDKLLRLLVDLGLETAMLEL